MPRLCVRASPGALFHDSKVIPFAKEFEVQSRKKGVVLAVHLQLRLTLCISIGANLPIDMEVGIYVFKLHRPFL